MQRKENQPAEPERKGERRRSDEAVGSLRAQHVASIAIAGSQQVTVKMHGALGLAGGSRCEADQAHVVGSGVARGEGVKSGFGHQRFERVGPAVAPVDDAREIAGRRTSLLHLVGEPMVAKGEPDFRLRDRIGDFLGAQQRHGRHHHAAGLEYCEISRHHHRAVGTAQQHAVAGHQGELAGEHIGDAVHALRELRIGERFRGRYQARPIAPAGCYPAIEQFAHAVQALGIVQLRQAEQKVRPLRGCRQIVARECVEMRRRNHGCRSSREFIMGYIGSLLSVTPDLVPAGHDGSYHYSAANFDFCGRFFNSSRAITIFWISVAPS